MKLTFYSDNENVLKLTNSYSSNSNSSRYPLNLDFDDEYKSLPLKLNLDTKKDKQLTQNYKKVVKKYPAIKQKYNKYEIYSLITNLKQQQIPMIDKIAIEIGRKYRDNNLLQEIAKKTNNPTLYWQVINQQRQERRKIAQHCEHCFMPRYWNKFANLRPAKALNANFGIGRK